jgi:hypothetical protein
MDAPGTVRFHEKQPSGQTACFVMVGRVPSTDDFYGCSNRHCVAYDSVLTVSVLRKRKNLGIQTGFTAELRCVSSEDD